MTISIVTTTLPLLTIKCGYNKTKLIKAVFIPVIPGSTPWRSEGKEQDNRISDCDWLKYSKISWSGIQKQSWAGVVHTHAQTRTHITNDQDQHMHNGEPDNSKVTFFLKM